MDVLSLTISVKPQKWEGHLSIIEDFEYDRDSGLSQHEIVIKLRLGCDLIEQIRVLRHLYRISVVEAKRLALYDQAPSSDAVLASIDDAMAKAGIKT